MAATQADQDTFTLQGAKKQKDWASFVQAMVKEVTDHEKDEHWELVPILQCKGKPVPVVWSFRRKRTPTGEVIKHKARLNVHGGQTDFGIHYWDTFAPVVQWFTIRVMLILSLVEGLETQSIDFVLAFPQAEIKADIYMKLLYGFVPPDDCKEYVLHLKKNLYGLKDASNTFWDKLRTTLLDKKHGFTQSQVDPCLFF